MTNKELLNQLDSTNPLMKGANYEALKDYILSLRRCVESDEKYKWHDLRKNPNDVPTEDGRKYIITQCGTKKYHIANWMDGNFGEFGISPFADATITFNEFAQVDRWREIEPFDEDVNVTNKENDDE